MALDERLLPQLLAAAVHEAFRNTSPLAPRTGTVVAIDPDLRTAEVLIDGDSSGTVVRLFDSVDVDDRVLIDFTPGGGVWMRGVLGGRKWHSYDVEWTTLGTQPSVGNGTLTGMYRRDGSACQLIIQLLCGTTTNGGTDSFRFSLPFPNAHPNIHERMRCDLYTANDDAGWAGFATIPPGDALARPYAPLAAGDVRLRQMNNNNAGVPGAGVPQRGGVLGNNIANGNSVTINGTYRVF